MKLIIKVMLLVTLLFIGTALFTNWWKYPLYDYHNAWEPPNKIQSVMIKIGLLREAGVIPATKPLSDEDRRLGRETHRQLVKK